MKTAINDVKIFDGTKTLEGRWSVLFDEMGILEVGEGHYTAELVIDGKGRTLTPGLIDGHVHMGASLSMSPNRDEGDKIKCGAIIADQARTAWRYGITTLCNCGTASDADIYVSELIREGIIEGPTIIACGRVLSITGGHGWSMSVACDSEFETLKAAREQIRLNADFVKLMATGGMGTKNSIPNVPQLTEGQMSAASEAANEVGKFTRAHATGLEGAKRAIRAGVRIIDHVQMDEETAEMMEEAGAYYCPTIVTRYNILHTEDPRYQYMRQKADPGDLDRKKKALMLCREHGIPVIAGTDAGPSDMVLIGPSLWTELKIYQEFGLSSEEALRAATYDAARALRIDDVTGSIAAGKRADLALFEGDPTEDVERVDTLAMTFQGGVLQYKV